MSILLSIYGNQYNEILNEAKIDDVSIAKCCGNVAGHMIKYMIQTNLQSASWVGTIFSGYKQFNRAERKYKSLFLSDSNNKFSDIVYKVAEGVLDEDLANSSYLRYCKDELKKRYWTNAQLVDPEFLKNFLLKNVSTTRMDKDSLEQEIDKFIKIYK